MGAHYYCNNGPIWLCVGGPYSTHNSLQELNVLSGNTAKKNIPLKGIPLSAFEDILGRSFRIDGD